MEYLELSLQQVAERVQSVVMTDQSQSTDFAEIMSFQSLSMMKQHESLGAIAYWLAKGNQTSPDDLKTLLPKARRIDKYDTILVHYLPSLLTLTSKYASSESECSSDDAQSLHQSITSLKDGETWSLRAFQAAVVTVWLADYSGHFAEAPSQTLDTDVETRAKMFSEALKDGAFQFMLAVGQDVRETEWYDPARHGFTSFLIQDTPALHSDSLKVDETLQSILMERFRNFVDAYITNMPDSLRRLKLEEDDQRRQVQGHVQLRPSEHELHLERFLIIISHAFECSPIAAEAFWDGPDGNLYGFLRWASQRQPTPRVAAFCEMLCAISNGESNANAAHKFLLDDTASSSARMRRNSPLSWNHIFRELEFYSKSIKDRPTPLGGRNNYHDQVVEPESAMMLECYLRLVAHLAQQSPEARGWLLTRTQFNLLDHLLLLCASGVESRLRACAFTALSKLLTDKDANAHHMLWSALDAWIFGQSQVAGALQVRGPHHRSPEELEKLVFEHLSYGFEEPNAFVGLLRSLLAPVDGHDNSYGSLPFPEDLGTRYRMAGIEPYVDFVMSLAFAAKSVELQDPVQLRIIRWNCLSFVTMCLSNFNEDLISLTKSSRIGVDSAIDTSSLAVYVRLHPFARIMEWLFNDSVIEALFATAVQNIAEINEATQESPIVLGLLQSLEVVDEILSLQQTYFDVVRPEIKMQSNTRRHTVANSALASFEDAITNHLDLIPMLGLYSGSGHERLAIASLRLLEKISMSRKLATPISGGGNRRFEKSRLIVALERDAENETISRWLAGAMTYDAREVASGAICPGLIIKARLLQFLATSMDAIRDRPSIAHLLLGFSCSSHSIYLDESSLFALFTSLFHSVMAFMIACPDGDPESSMYSWLLTLKNDAFRIFRSLWRSPLSSKLALTELRLQDFLCSMSLQQSIIRSDALIDSRSIDDPDFYLTESAAGYAAFLKARSAFLEYAATEFRLVSQSELATLKARIQSSLFGTTTLLDRQQYSNPTIFDYLDFLEIHIGGEIPLVESRYFDASMFHMSVNDDNADLSRYERKVEQIVRLRQTELQKQGQLNNSSDQQQMEADAQNFMQCFVANYQRLAITTAYGEALHSWVQLATVMLECCNLSPTQQNAFVLQLLQQTLPKLGRSYSEDPNTALVLAKFVRSLLCHAGLPHSSADAKVPPDNIQDQFFEAFRTGLIGIQIPEATSSLRATCAQLCQGYLGGLLQQSGKNSSRALHCVKSTGDNLMETLCEDAYSGEGDCKVSALALLDSLVVLANEQKSKYVLDSFNRYNFIQVITGAIRALPSELQTATAETVPMVLSFYDASLSLLLRVAQSRVGAAVVFNVGFVAAVRESGIFGADPDIGLGQYLASWN